MLVADFSVIPMKLRIEFWKYAERFNHEYFPLRYETWQTVVKALLNVSLHFNFCTNLLPVRMWYLWPFLSSFPQVTTIINIRKNSYLKLSGEGIGIYHISSNKSWVSKKKTKIHRKASHQCRKKNGWINSQRPFYNTVHANKTYCRFPLL